MEVKWQPIETAPRDGTAFFGTSTYIEGVSGMRPIWHVVYMRDATGVFCNVSVSDYDPLYELTHWAPIPAEVENYELA